MKNKLSSEEALAEIARVTKQLDDRDVQYERVTLDNNGTADRVIGCTSCGKPSALVGDRIPADGLCLWCRAAAAPGVARLYRAGITPALDDIAKLCGCPEWDYPGQLVRDVQEVIGERDRLRAEAERLQEKVARMHKDILRWREYTARQGGRWEDADE